MGTAAHDRPALPSGATSSIAVQRSAAAFSQTPTDNIAYVVLERKGPLDDHDRALYDQLLIALRGDPGHVIQVVDWWGAPATADAAVSGDRQVATAMVRLSGMLGTSQASDSIVAVRNMVAHLAVPHGLQVFITGPGASILDTSTAIGRQQLTVTATAVVALLVLLLLIYRSAITAMVPLGSASLALAVAGPIVDVLGRKDLVGVSRFSSTLGTVVALGTGAGFAILLIGRYREQRRHNPSSATALADAYRATAPVIVGAALVLAAALSCLNFTRMGTFRDDGSPCAISVLIATLAALTLTPALIALADRASLLRPRRQRMPRRWWRIGLTTVRSPGSVIAGSATFLFALGLPLAATRVGWEEATAAPATAESTLGYRVVDQHFAPNELSPDIVTIETDHDIRNPPGLIAVEQITGAIMTITGVRMVQSASRLNGAPPQQVTLTAPVGPMGNIGDRLEEVSERFSYRDTALADLDSASDEMALALDEAQDGLRQGTAGLGQVSSAARRMQGAISKLRGSVRVFADTFAPLNAAVAGVPDCATNRLCHVVQQVTQWAGLVVDASTNMADGFGKVADGLAQSGGALSGLPLPGPLRGSLNQSLSDFAAELQQARAAMDGFKKLINALGTPIRELPRYLHDLASFFSGSPGAGLSVSLKTLNDPAAEHVLDSFISPNGHATQLFVYGDGRYWAGKGGERASAIMAAVRGSTEHSTLKPTAVELTGVGPTIRDIQLLLRDDLIPIMGVTLAVIFAIVCLVLRSLVAGLVIICSAAASYASAIGVNVVIWQYLAGRELLWSALPISFLVLVAACCGHHIHLARRAREELPAGSYIGLIRALTATGGISLAAGMACCATILALGTASAVSIAQIGAIVGVGLVLDNLVIRNLALPAAMAVLHDWFWWPRRAASRGAN